MTVSARTVIIISDWAPSFYFLGKQLTHSGLSKYKLLPPNNGACYR